MNIYSTINIGDFHENNCEDFLVHEKIRSNNLMIAVMDGCTMGKESVFASTLIGKILRKIAKEKFYTEFVNQEKTNINNTLKEVLKSLFIELKSVKNTLGLETEELLSTLILGIVDPEKSKAEFVVIGDGLICVDEEIIEFDQDDKPDYLGYHLSENFDVWYDGQEQNLSINTFQDLSICTDGIYTFKNFLVSKDQKSEKEIIKYLLIDTEGSEKENMLVNKVRQLKDTLKHVVTDDLAIIRIRL
jgi:hypothetical protein